MGDDANGNRTHEPNLRELTAELDGLRDLLLAKLEAYREIIDERDKRYSERDVANKAAVHAALAAAEKAAEKTESALSEYKQGANEWRDTVKDLIANLRESRSQSGGEMRGERLFKDDSRSNVAIVVAAVSTLLSIATLVINLLRG